MTTLFDATEFGQRLRDLREARCWSLDEVAAKVEMSKTGLWQLEMGRSEPMLRTAYRLALLYGVTLEHLVRGESLPEPGDTRIICPECGPVGVEADVFEGGRPVSGLCPRCGDRLYFA
jgi:transcriptional regulator with XRE-family HTH domain